MIRVDLDSLIAVLDASKHGGRRHVDELAAAVRQLAAHVEPAAVPELVLVTIRRGEAAGYWSAARTTTVLRGHVTLPKTVTLPRGDQPSDKRRPVDVPLRRELAPWATTLRLSTAQRVLLLAVNDWLKQTNGGDVPIAAVAERAYELLGDEKAFDSTPPQGGSTLWRDDRLTFELLRCERIPTPLTWEPTIPVVTARGPVVCVENHATFRTLLRILRSQESPTWMAVAWVQGRNTAPLESLTKLPFTATRLDYLGDLDAAGLQIAATACATADRIGVPSGPATILWELLIHQPSRSGRKIDYAQARSVVSWLPETVQDSAVKLFVQGRRIPQEALRYDVLKLVLS